MSNKLWLLQLLLVFWLTSCGPTPYFEEYIEIPEEGWHRDSSVLFHVEIEDTSEAFNIYLNLRSNSHYPYSNIYLFREIRSSRGIEFRDTAEYFLADPYGRWLGEGIGELRTHHLAYSGKSLKFRRSGIYTFEIQQAMRIERLKGVEDIGLSIFRSKRENE